MIIKKSAVAAVRYLRHAGFDLYRILCLLRCFKYIAHYYKFLKRGGAIKSIYPILTDYNAPAGIAKGHYFHQDLLVASFVFDNAPIRHIDIGSRVDGFVAHVASYRPIEVIDIRQLEGVGHDNISFLRLDIMNLDDNYKEIADSISCLHAIEHFGLGRYGDQIDPMGHITGFKSILTMLKKNGTLYISFPIARSGGVYFNAHRVFNAKEILSWSNSENIVRLQRFDYVDDLGRLHRDVDISLNNINVEYGCGIYTFKKIG